MDVLCADSFWTALDRLTTDEQTAAKASLTDLLRAPESPGFQLHRVGVRVDGLWSARVNQDIRFILQRRLEAIVACYVDHHDAAYAWAERRRVDTHEVTGALQIIEAEERVEERIKTVTTIRYQEHAESPTDDDARGSTPFAALTDDQLLSFGVPRGYLHMVREANEEAFVDVLMDALPDEACECLYAVLNDEEPVLPQRSSDPLRHPDTLRRFHRIDVDDRDLAHAFDRPFEAWRLFLHPSQRSAVEADYAGPARVTGGPGTGKSVVAVHRARHLATATHGTVFLTSFSRTLAARLARDIESLVDSTEAATRITTVNLHHLAMTLTEQRGPRMRVLQDREIPEFAERAAADAGVSSVSTKYLAAEWIAVVDPYGITSESEYARIRRASRGTQLSARQRSTLWPAFARMRELLAEEGATTWSTLCWDLVARLDTEDERLFDHVIADEVQDFGPAELRLLRALVPEGRNDVFLAGDVNQRIFKPSTGLARAGLEVRGRATILRLNYRTTHQIRRMAQSFLRSSGVPVDEESAKTTSLMSGPEPELRTLMTVNEEVRTVAKWLQELVSNGVRPEESAIFARTKRLLQDRGMRAVAAANLKASLLEEEAHAEPKKVALGTMHRSKGLQFRAVAIIGVERGEIPLVRVLDDIEDDVGRKAFVELERNLLYVSATRARERLLITGARAISPLLEPEAQVRAPSTRRRRQ